MGLVDNTPTGRLILQIMLSFAEFEREMIKERTAAGKAIARQKPGYKEGRPKQITPEFLNFEPPYTERYVRCERSEINRRKPIYFLLLDFIEYFLVAAQTSQSSWRSFTPQYIASVIASIAIHA